VEATMIEFIIKGGIVMWPIIGSALFGIAIILERSIYFFITNVKFEEFKEVLLNAIQKCGLTNDLILENPYAAFASLVDRIQYEKWNRSPYNKIVTTYLNNINNPVKLREEVLKRVGSEEIEKMERYFQGLSVISHVSPLLGLLGTVTGIISAFAVISKLGGQVDVTALAGGIWEAMITTAAGLIVAIPSQIAYLYFEKIVSSRANNMSYIISYLNEYVYKNTLVENLSEDNTPEFADPNELIPVIKVSEEIVKDEVK